LNAAAAAGLFVIGASLHSRRAGLIAALIFAFWLPNIWTYALFMQEQLYVPLLVLSFALLVRAMAAPASNAAFALAGVAFGLAAMTRSMPVYFIFPAAIGYALLTRDRLSVRRAAALLGGFLIVTGAYSLWLSWQVGKLVYIENHAGISVHNFGGTRAPGVPGHDDIVGQLSEAFFGDPRGFFGLWWSYVLALFHVHGDRWLHFYRASTATGAAIAKLVAHAGIDGPFIVSVILAPVGAVLARRSKEAAALVFWIVLVVVLTAVSATGGIRYRSPFEPHLIALASVVLAGAWRRPGRIALIAGLAISVVAASILLPQIPRVARARANYGLQPWSDAEGTERMSTLGRAGLNMLPKDGMLEMAIYALDGDSPQSTRVFFWIDGHQVADRVIDTDPLRVRFVARHRGIHYVEVNAIDATGAPRRIGLELLPVMVVAHGSPP
jgi:4-amino-4-deoxy-L-arabinose transferase-like glycosyltransferase